MRFKLTREVFVPKDAAFIEDPQKRGIVYFGDTPKPWAKAFHGKQAKPDWFYTFKTREQRDARITQHFESLQKHVELLAKWKEERKETRKTDDSTLTKQALTPIFGKDVSVTRGSGTAHSWLRILVKIPRPADCTGRDFDSQYRHEIYCEACKETRELAQRLIDKATEHIDYPTYCSDDGYNTERICVNTDIYFDGQR